MTPISSHAQLAAVIATLHDTDPAGQLFIVPFTDADPPLAIGTVRYRLPDPADPEATVRLTAHAMAYLKKPPWNLMAGAAVAAFGPEHLADPFLETLTVALLTCGTGIYDVLRIHQGRCWSYLCDDDGHDRLGPGIPVDPWDDAVIQVATEQPARSGGHDG